MTDDPSCNLTEFVQFMLGNHTHVKAVPQDAKFMRKGVIGDWKNHFDQEALDIFNELAGPMMENLGYQIIENI